MSSDLTTVEAVAVVPAVPQTVTSLNDGNILVVAENPGELQLAQQALIDWFIRKAEQVDSELTDARNELENARASKWRLGPFQKMVRDLECSFDYYSKARAAVEQGYCIVPNFPVDVMAIRTDRNIPSGGHRGTWRPRLGQSADKLPEGDGEYVDPNPKVVKTETDYKTNTAGQRVVDSYWWEATEFKDVALPVKFMKPRVLQATQHAMALKIFDEIAVLPARRKSDPIVVGRILGPKNKSMTFMIAWFIDSRDL